MDDVNESDCCGNGCANCVLNTKAQKAHNIDKNGKRNVLGKYTKFLLINKIQHLQQVETVWELHFKSKECHNKDFMLDIDAGYHLMMRILSAENELKGEKNKIEKDRKYLLRPYSPYWWEPLKMEFKILIDLKANGPMSEYIRNLKINDEVEFRGPIGKFDYRIDRRADDNYLLIISQGVAIAPAIPIIEQILNNEDDLTRIFHIACFQNMEHVYFRDKLYDFAKYWNYKVHIYLSRELCDNTDCMKNLNCMETCRNFKSKLKYKEIIKPYRFTENELLKIVNDLGVVKENAIVTISGTGKFQNYFKELCVGNNCGLLDNNIYLL